MAYFFNSSSEIPAVSADAVDIVLESVITPVWEADPDVAVVSEEDEPVAVVSDEDVPVAVVSVEIAAFDDESVGELSAVVSTCAYKPVDAIIANIAKIIFFIVVVL